MQQAPQLGISENSDINRDLNTFKHFPLMVMIEEMSFCYRVYGRNMYEYDIVGNGR